jgi:hypothetical protein
MLSVVKGPFLAVLSGSPVKGNRTQALKDPILDVTDLDDGFIADLLEREDRDWAKDFQVFKSEGITEERDEQRTLELIRTVKKPKKIEGGLSSPEKQAARTEDTTNSATELANVFTEFYVIDKELSDAKDKLEEAEVNGVANDGTTEADARSAFETSSELRFQALALLLSALNDWIKRGFAEAVETSNSLESAVEGLRAMIAAVEGQVGAKPKALKHLGSALWSAVESLSEVAEQNQATLADHAEELSELVNFKEIILDELAKDNETSSTSNETEALPDEDPIGSKMGGFITPRRGGRKVNSTGVLGRSEGDGNGGFGSPDSLTTRGGGEYVLKSEFNTFQDEVRRSFGAIEKRLIMLEANEKGDDESCWLGSTIIRHRNDLKLYFEGLEIFGEGARIPASCFVTPHLLLNRTYKSLCSHTLKLADHRALATLNLGHTEHELVSSMLTALPLICTEGRMSSHTYVTKSGVGRFKALPSWEDWGLQNEPDSLCNKFFTQLDQEKEFFVYHLANELGGCQELELACRNILDNSFKFCTQMLSFLGSTYQAMVASFAQSDDTWDMACFGLFEVFMKEFKAPLASFTSRDFLNVNKTLLDATLVALKIDKVVKTFTDRGVNEHSALHSAKINFVIQKGLGKNGTMMSGNKRSRDDEELIKKLQEEVTTLSKSYEQHESRWRKKIASLEKMATAACNKLDLPTTGR